MDNTMLIFIIRIIISFLGGNLLSYLFFTPKDQNIDWLTSFILTLLIISIVYFSKIRKNHKNKKQ